MYGENYVRDQKFGPEFSKFAMSYEVNECGQPDARTPAFWHHQRGVLGHTLVEFHMKRVPGQFLTKLVLSNRVKVTI